MRKPQTLQNKIRVKLFTIIGIYLLCTTILILALAIFSITIYQKNQLEQYEELVKTKIDADISAALREANSLGTSPIIWTGLTDSVGRDTYLSPLLQRINVNSRHKIDLLDYRGRDFIITDEFPGGTRSNLISVSQVVQTEQIHTEFLQKDSKKYYLIALPIKAPFSDSSIGVLLINFDINASIDSLKIPNNLLVTVDQPGVLPSTKFGYDEISSDLTIEGGDYRVMLSIGVAKSIYENFISVLAGFFIVSLGAIFVFLSLKRWTESFSLSTTERLNELVRVASRVADGKDFAPISNSSKDEIDAILSSIQNIFLKQKEANAKLLISSRVFETAGEAILISGANGEIVDVNKTLLDITGYAREQLIGHPAGMLYRNTSYGISDKFIAESLEKQGFWKGETYFLTVDKRLVPVMLAISVLVDSAGVSQGNVAIFSDITLLKATQDKLKELIYEDQLTGLPNFRAFFEYISEQLDLNANSPFVLLFIDLDYFKNINDTYNHQQGDRAICQVAQYLGANLPSPHKLFRRSGDEFIAIVNVEESLIKTKTALSSVLHHVTIEVSGLSKNMINSSFSSGAAIYPDNSNNIQDLLIFADTALQVSKEKGRSRITWFDDSVKKQVARQNQIEIRLVDALSNNKITPFYQPEIDLRTGEIIGFEALARWRDEELGFISPAEFVHIAEQRGLIDRLTECMIKKMFADLKLLMGRFGEIKISFNSSPRLFADNKIYKILVDGHAGSDIDCSHLIMEITESELLHGTVGVSSQLECIIGLGIQIAIDDFGKGFSSLSRLSKLPIGKLKIDSSFVTGFENSANIKIIESIISLSKSLNLDVTAEGVETLEQRQMLIELGCFKAQGYLYSRALPLDEVLSLPICLSPRLGET